MKKTLRCANCKRKLDKKREIYTTYQGEIYYCQRFKCFPKTQRGQLRRLNCYKRNDTLRLRKSIKSLRSWLYGNKRRTAELERTTIMRKVVKHHPRKKSIYSQDFVAVRWE